MLCASLFFYSWGAPKFVFVVVISALSDYVLSRRISPKKANKNRRNGYLVLALAVNLSLLLYFKYMNFFVEQFSHLLKYFGGEPGNWVYVALPIGISFFTFQKMSYLIDVYRGVTPSAKSYWHYLLYVLLFPQLIAGPIVRYHDIADQLAERNHSSEKILQGMWRFALGLAKKVFIANEMGRIADLAFDGSASGMSGADAWLGAACYTFQIYFDFSGYSDMAIGLGLMFGFRFLENFNHPYISKNITEFWRRWHISLSNWMREYLYIPLGGNQVGRGRRVVNLWTVFLVTGFWHGATWSFVIWGMYHGLLLSLDKISGRVKQVIPSFFSLPATFVLVLIGWVFFRAENIGSAIQYLSQMTGAHGWSGNSILSQEFTPQTIGAICIAVVYSFSPAFSAEGKGYAQTSVNEGSSLYSLLGKTALTIAFLSLSMMLLVTSDFNPFIYFRF